MEGRVRRCVQESILFYQMNNDHRSNCYLLIIRAFCETSRHPVNIYLYDDQGQRDLSFVISSHWSFSLIWFLFRFYQSYRRVSGTHNDNNTKPTIYQCDKFRDAE